MNGEKEGAVTSRREASVPRLQAEVCTGVCGREAALVVWPWTGLNVVPDTPPNQGEPQWSLKGDKMIKALS